MWAVQLWEAAAIVSRPSVFCGEYCKWFTVIDFLAGFLTKKHHNASHLISILLRLQSVAIWAAARIVKSLLSVHTGFSSSKTETLQAINARTCELKY